jgi:mannose-6-phosphate isomerase-like protein (cupin superfamily)
MSAGQEVRRVVTGHDASGKAVVLHDGPTPTRMTRPDTGVTARLLWHTDATPANMTGTIDRATIKTGIAPPANGSVFRIVEFPPAGDLSKLGNDFYVREMHTAAPSGKRRPSRHPFMHFTDSIDYAVVMSGEIDMLLDDSEIHLKAGDVLVQLGTNHAWVNRGSAPCRIAFVLIDARDPLAE